MKPTLHATPLILAALAVSGNFAIAQDSTPFTFEVVPYLWVASPDIETQLPGTPPGVGSDVQRFDTKIAAGAMLAGAVHYNSFGAFFDFAWLRLETSGISPGPAFGSTELTSDLIHSTAGLSYRLPLEGRFQVTALAGARLWSVQEEFEATSGVLPGFATEADRTWVDPVVGLDLRYDLGGRWSLVGKGIVGGFGVSADFAAEALVGVNFRLSDHWFVGLGYRYLHERYDKDRFSLDLDAQGFLLGVGCRF